MEQIKNDQLTLEISSLGAELQSIKDANGTLIPQHFDLTLFISS